MSRYSSNLRETGRVNRFLGKFLGKRCQLQNNIARVGSLAAAVMVALVPEISAMAAETVPPGGRAGVVWAFDAALPGARGNIGFPINRSAAA
jgi:hypothetical protein